MDIEDLIPTLDVEAYKTSLLSPLIGWSVFQILWFLFSVIDSVFNSSKSIGTNASFGYPTEIVILFGVWVGISLARNGCNIGDVIVGGIIIGITTWILWFILFPLIDPADRFAFSKTKPTELNFEIGMLPMLWTFILLQVGAALTAVGIMDALSTPPQPKKVREKKEKKPKETKAKETKEEDAASEDKPKKATKKPRKKATKKSTKSDE